MATSNRPGSVMNGKVILATGATGSFGKVFVKEALTHFNPKRLIVFSRDELKQFEMAQIFPKEKYPAIEFILGDVRDKDRLRQVMNGVDILVHAAALKQVPPAEYNPGEFIKTNVLGAMNLIDVAIEKGVKKVVALSTDKASNPINLYGATKLCSDKLFIAGNCLAEGLETRFSVVRYGNVVGSRGSVVPFFQKMRKTGVLPITDAAMTRFFITLEEGVNLVCSAMENMLGGEIFVPKIGSIKITDLAKIIAPECDQRVIGIRPGEKLHESLISPEEGRTTFEFPKHYVIASEVVHWAKDQTKIGGKLVKPGFAYTSDTNEKWFTADEMNAMIASTSALQDWAQ